MLAYVEPRRFCMRRGPVCLLGLTLAGSIAGACGSGDKVRHAYDDSAGAGGQPAGDGDGGAAIGPGAEGGFAPSGGGEGPGATGGGAPRTATGGAGSGSAGSGPVEPGADFVPAAPRIALGGPHSCVLKLDQSVWCWGRDDHDEAGGLSATAELSPTKVDLGPVSQLVAGQYHNCALLGSPAGV